MTMTSERDKMLAGESYVPFDPDLTARRTRARDLCQTLNATRENDADHRRALLRDLFGGGGDSVWMQPPFYCDYGENIRLGERVFFNFNCVVLDVCPVTIGARAVIGAGSVVTRDIPAGVFAAGNPRRAIRDVGE